MLKMFRSLTGPSAEGQRDRATIKGAYQRIEDLLCPGGRGEFCVRGRAHMRKKEIDAACVMDSWLEEIGCSLD